MTPRTKLTLAIVCLALGLLGRAISGGIHYGPYHAVLGRIIDGDTVVMQLETEPDHIWKVSVRLRGVDTPETVLRRKDWEPCQIPMGKAAEQFTKQWFLGATAIRVDDLTFGSFPHRAVATISAVKDGARHDLGKDLLASGNARPFEKGNTGKGWCPN